MNHLIVTHVYSFNVSKKHENTHFSAFFVLSYALLQIYRRSHNINIILVVINSPEVLQHQHYPLSEIFIEIINFLTLNDTVLAVHFKHNALQYFIDTIFQYFIDTILLIFYRKCGIMILIN